MGGGLLPHQSRLESRRGQRYDKLLTFMISPHCKCVAIL